jgi:hypothetical protein
MVSDNGNTPSSPYIGQRCPISHRPLSVGDEVLICEQTKTVFVLNAWQQIVPSWGYICRFCNTPVKRLYGSSGPPVTANTTKQQKAKPPTYEPSRGNILSTRIQFAGIGVLLSLVVIVAFSLGRNNPQPVTQKGEDSARQTSISLATQPASLLIATDALPPMPTPSLEMERLISTMATPELSSTYTPVPTLSQTSTPQVHVTATAEKKATLTVQALVEDSRRKTVTAQAGATHIIERKATLAAQTTTATEKRQTATAQARTAATAVAIKTVMAASMLNKSATEQFQVITPDNFIRNYYNAINQRQYQFAFSLLSTSFKENYHCCEKNGSYKYDEYVNWWNSVKEVEIQKVEIQKLNSSRATVYTVLRFYYRDDRIVDDQHLFQLISDEKVGWLIDE